VLSWLLIALIPVAAVVLRFLADDHPRSDDPPDPDGEDRLPALLAA
jgi:hypothetical protein